MLSRPNPNCGDAAVSGMTQSSDGAVADDGLKSRLRWWLYRSPSAWLWVSLPI